MISEVDQKAFRLYDDFTRLSSTPKPKEKKVKKPNRNITINNITVDGSEGDVNWEDYVKFESDLKQEEEKANLNQE